MTGHYQLQDVDKKGDAIYRFANSEKEAIKLAQKDYPKVIFEVISFYPHCEACS